MDTFYLDLPKGAPTAAPSPHPHFHPCRSHHWKAETPRGVIVPGKVYRRDNPDATHSSPSTRSKAWPSTTDITFCDFTGTIEYS